MRTIAFSNSQGLALPVLAVFTVALLVVPLDPWILDVLIAINICFGIGLLVYSLNVKSPSHLSTFPSILLFTTAFRIALNVATSRQILLEGDAGHIVEAFGQWVVGGNIVVGLVIFFIIALVQFIVIAKGSERVAEVAARFTLDALPGKQVSIDSDLRSGLLTQDQAKAARAQLGVESQMFGAMDGAMKFVKGDVVAGMVIVFINLLGGIAIGIFYFQLSAGESVAKYAVLSVGDGLVSQIPALLVAMAAGILVTRATNDGNAPNLGGQISGQLLAHPQALLITGGMTLLFCFVPALPTLAFLLVGGAVTGAGVALLNGNQKQSGQWNPSSNAPVRDGSVERRPLLTAPEAVEYAPVILEISEKLIGLISPSSFENEILAVRKRVLRDIGLPFPGMVIRPLLGATELQCQLRLHDVPLLRLQVPDKRLLAMASQQRLLNIGLPVKAEDATLGGATWVTPEERSRLDMENIETRELNGSVAWLVEAFIREHAVDLLGLEEVQSIISQAKVSWPELTNQATSSVPLTRLTKVLRNLLTEQVPIRNIPTIFQALVYASQLPNDDVSLTEAARRALSTSIVFQVSRGTMRIEAVMITGELEEMLRSAINHSVDGPILSLHPEQVAQVQKAVEFSLNRCMSSLPADAPIAVVTTPDLRWHLHLLLHDRLPGLPILATDEIPSTAKTNIRHAIADLSEG